ncbi:MAG: hypothetical protein AVO33_07230 [delta proteobacterium ML8_F1]|nr:MAG: hypothetical protein AVO33_07230 [delta proteobacterium ML8_F1]
MWQIEIDPQYPVYQNIAKHIEKLILNEVLKPRDPLPSVRALSRTLGVNKDTVVNAYEQLSNRGTIYKIPGKGTFVREFSDIGAIEAYPSKAATYPYDFTRSVISTDYFPVAAFKDSFERVLERDRGNAFTTEDSLGHLPLRQVILTHLEAMGVEASLSSVMIISGAQQGIDIVSRNLLTPKDHVFIENPTYQGASSYFKAMGVRLTGIGYRDQDLDLERLETELKWYRPRLMYTMPNFQNPTGFSYSETTKQRLAALAEEYAFYIIEDDYTNEINYGNPVVPLKAYDTHQRVIYIKSFSKILIPGFRVSFIVMPPNLTRDLESIKAMTDLTTSGILQRALADFMAGEGYPSHIIKIHALFAKRMDKAYEFLTGYLPGGIEVIKPRGGISFWIRVPKGISASKLLSEAQKEGVTFSLGSDFYLQGTPGKAGWIRLSFGGIEEELIEEGIRLLGRSMLKCIYEDKNKILID